MQLDTGFDFYRDSCIWPDHPKKRAEEHFINVARNANGIGPNEQCPTANVCLLSAIEDDMSVLSSPGSSDEDKLKSLPSMDPEDYQVFKDGQALGRIYRSSSTGPAPYWHWSVYGGPRGGRPHAGIADSLDEAKAAWLYGWQGAGSAG